MQRVAVVGGGISGLGAAYVLAKAGVDVELYEKESYVGGHLAKNVTIDGLDLGLACIVYNRVTYPQIVELFDSLGIDVEETERSFSVSLDDGRVVEWGTRNGFRSLFAQKSNVLNPNFWKMIQEVNKFNDDVILYLDEVENNQDLDHVETLGHFIKTKSYSEFFLNAYLVPMCSSIWSCSPENVMQLSAFHVLSFCRNHYLLQMSSGLQWLTVKGRSNHFVNKIREELEVRGCKIKTNSEVHSVLTSDKGCTLSYGNGLQDVYDRCIVAIPAPDTAKLLGKEATHDEMRILGAFQYVKSDVYLHHDKSFMPLNSAAWGACNFIGGANSTGCLTYWLNSLQFINSRPIFVTLSPPRRPESVVLRWSTSRLVPSVTATKALLELDKIQGRRGIWFTGAHHGYGFYEDALKAGVAVAHAMLGKSFIVRKSEQMVYSWAEGVARRYVIRFLKNFVSAGSITLLEEGGSVVTIDGSDKGFMLKTTLRVHNPQFYWKVAMEADLGLADAYINGHISFINENEGLLNMFKIFQTNLNSHSSASGLNRKWLNFKGWTPMLFTAGIASAKYIYRHLSRRNTVKQARANIARHYDLSNEMFSLFLDETMTYSCAVFKSDNEDLKVAQLRKLHLLIDKARVEEHHEVLEIGCGWGSLGIEAVKRTGCRYTGISLAKEQIDLAQQRVNEAGVQDRVKFLLCDYRQVPNVRKYDRIISCGMIEHVGHEYYEEFFRCCESLLSEDGVLVLQFISIGDDKYDDFRRSPGFIKEYIFPGGCLPSLSRVTSAMGAGSRLCVEHVENIGKHYYQTLRSWRKNFLDNQSKILSLGFDEKFLRIWEYYFDYCAAGFAIQTLGDYQIVMARPGHLAVYPYAATWTQSL